MDACGGAIKGQNAGCEACSQHPFESRRQAQGAIFEFIEGWYNPHRRHQGLGYHSPMDFESHYQEAA